MSLTFTLTGRTSELCADHFPPISLEGEWVVGLLGFETYNSIPNIDKNNKFRYGVNNEMEIPKGAYEIDDINQYIKSQLTARKVSDFSLRGNKNTFHTEIKCSKAIDFGKTDTIGSLLGFSPRILPPGELHISDKVANIFKINAIIIDCNIVSGAYKNGRPGHTLHEFFLQVSPGYKIVETPGEVIYLPVNTRTIDNLSVTVTDQNGDLVNFNGEELVVRLHLKQIASNNGVGN